MRTAYFLSGFLCWFLLACGSSTPSEQNGTQGFRNDTSLVLQMLTVRKNAGEQNRTTEMRDSLVYYSELNLLLQKATEYPHGQFSFRKNGNAHSGFPTRSYQMGSLFSENKNHLVAGLASRDFLYFDIFEIRQDSAIPLLHHRQWALEYVNDTLQDINGDGFADFAIEGYGVNGCCLKKFFRIFLYNPLTGSFSGEFFLINPTFFPKEHKIRGVEYGHSGETDLYTYAWDGFALDTVETLTPDTQNSGYYIRRVKSTSGWKEMILPDVPAGYRSIFGFDWFMNDLE